MGCAKVSRNNNIEGHKKHKHQTAIGQFYISSVKKKKNEQNKKTHVKWKMK